MKPTLDFIKDMATHAGKILLSYAESEDLDIQRKGQTDLVTEADHASEEYLIDVITKTFPNHAIVAEESGGRAGDTDHQWYIDPLDGTLNYAHGVPIYCVSIGYAYQGELTLGVVYDPTRDEYYCAERGQGATLNGKPIHVSNFTDLIDCMLVTGFPYDLADAPDNNNANFIRFNAVARTVRRLGSAALDMVYVAAGRMDGFWELEIFQYDVAAAGLIVREAGGVVTDVYGNHDFMAKPVTICCANPTIHQKMLDVLADVRARREAV